MLRILFVLALAVSNQSVTGCLDQQGEAYVLRDLKDAAKVAVLRGKAFKDDNFAKYVGHKVTVHGDVTKEGETTIVHVTKIEDQGAGCSAPK